MFSCLTILSVEASYDGSGLAYAVADLIVSSHPGPEPTPATVGIERPATLPQEFEILAL